jgi:hypothetical protein
MSFNVLFVEDTERDWQDIETAIAEVNKRSKEEAQDHPSKWPRFGDLRIDRARNPSQIEEKLDLRFDLVLADVYFANEAGVESNCLKTIIEIIRRYDKKKGGRPMPIVAYTHRGKEALEECLEHWADLYDIWDKGMASPEYVAWRLGKLAEELTRIRPDALLQRLIRDMPDDIGLPWHKNVKEMARKYDSGWSERDQIQRCGDSINAIADKLQIYSACSKLWEVMIAWEYLSRAVSRTIRGHARHVINVFWLGYYLIHHEHLKTLFRDCWSKLLDKREDTGAVRKIDQTESISGTWFLAGLFHDVGGCIEKAHEVKKHFETILSVFGDVVEPFPNEAASPKSSLVKRAADVTNAFPDSLRDGLREAFSNSIVQGSPDQGLIAALYFRQEIIKAPVEFYAREAGRAAALHNVFPNLGNGSGELPISWEDDPISCLLLLCDQLQTWDRDRGDATIYDDSPSRAELKELSIAGNDDGRPTIEMMIDYITPPHLVQGQEFFEREKGRLDDILRKYPSRALSRIKQPWPFDLHVSFSFGGIELETTIDIRIPTI